MCAYELGIPVTMVTVDGLNSVTDVNNSPDGGGSTSDTACQVLWAFLKKAILSYYRNDCSFVCFIGEKQEYSSLR